LEKTKSGNFQKQRSDVFMNQFTLSASPHIKSDQNVSRIMLDVNLALVPALAVSLLFFGLGALWITVLAIASCVVFEYLAQKFVIKTAPTITDGSAALTGLLLAFNVPSNLPWWMIILGSFVAIMIAKISFGGLGNNIFNPALVARVFLLISFPVQMTNWPLPNFLQWRFDGQTGATVLSLMKEGLKSGKPVSEIMTSIPNYTKMFFGEMGGSLGEVSAAALILGGLYLLYRRVITWHIPVSYLLTVFIFAGILWMVNDIHYPTPLFTLLSGGLMLGAIFMATDMVTSPMSPAGQLIFGAGCGVLTVVIRYWGGYPEGVSFAILIMNVFTPLINTLVKPRRFGAV
jgi:electron transport complex protein RnfD